MELQDLILHYLLILCTTIVLPTTIWIMASCRIFSRIRTFSLENYKEQVQECLEDTLIERIAQLLNTLFPEYGLTPSRCAPFSTIVQGLLNQKEGPERLSLISEMYKSLVENGIQSPFFDQIVQVYLTMVGGGGIV
ncbi:hypothetical protein LguiA_035854 [Lonicera macranthoides]